MSVTCWSWCVYVCSRYVFVCFSQPPQSAAAGAQPVGSRLAWALPVSSSPSSALALPAARLPLGPAAPSTRVVRPRRDGDAPGKCSV